MPGERLERASWYLLTRREPIAIGATGTRARVAVCSARPTIASQMICASTMCVYSGSDLRPVFARAFESSMHHRRVKPQHRPVTGSVKERSVRPDSRD